MPLDVSERMKEVHRAWLDAMRTAMQAYAEIIHRVAVDPEDKECVPPATPGRWSPVRVIVDAGVLDES